jgi:hypothetical protein
LYRINMPRSKSAALLHILAGLAVTRLSRALPDGDGDGRDAPPLAVLSYPVNGTQVTAGKMVVVDVVMSEAAITDGWYACLRLSASDPWACFDDPDTMQLTATREGGYQLHAALSASSRHEAGASPEAAAAELNHGTPPRWSAWSQWEAVPDDYCTHGHRRHSGGNGTARCGDVAAHCTSMGRFRFYLYPATHAPTLHAAAVYHALSESPFRTQAPDMACVFITATDVRVANYNADTAFTAARRLTRLPYWGPSGARHLILDFADYGAHVLQGC